MLLLARVLRDRFRFPADAIVTLSEASGRRPTRANVMAELGRLATAVGSGDRVVVLLAGHGSQQPDQEPFDEPDGLDQVFLPCDAGSLGGSRTAIQNAIIDDELNAWSAKIGARGAHLWFIADCCHSGTLLRGLDSASREVPAKDFFSDEILEKARRAAARKARSSPPQELRWAALYASQRGEPTIELPPLDGSSKARHGLLTHTVCRVLMQAHTPLTYRELAQQVHAYYVRHREGCPTPLVEGLDQDREVLGERVWRGRSRFTLTRTRTTTRGC